MFCRQVSASEYEDQSRTQLRLHMGQLLDIILTDTAMTDKEKRTKLKMVITVEPPNSGLLWACPLYRGVLYSEVRMQCPF